jgi:sulfide:quinone oxidoreductase
MTTRPAKVLIAGGGIAALELLLALRVLAHGIVDVTLLTERAALTPPAMTVATPFGRGGARSYEWPAIAAEQGAELVLDRLIAVDVAERMVFTSGGRRMGYDVLALATGARRVEPLAGALTFGASDAAEPDLRGVLADVAQRGGASMAFVLPSPAIWPLPIYELALLAAGELREHGCTATVPIVTPEPRALALLGTAARDAVMPLLDALGVELVTDAQACERLPDGLRLRSGREVAADHVVTLADIVARPVPGLPLDRGGFIPVDLHGRVAGETGVYAAGEATSFPLRQGGLAAQQADAVAEAIAAGCGAGNEPAPFMPVLRGRMLTSGAPLYFQARPSGQSLASSHALWSPPGKVAGRYVAPYLGTARPPRMGTAPLAERVPALARFARDDARDAVTLALAIADAEECCGHPRRALQAREAAQMLDAVPAMPAEHAQLGPPPDAGARTG